MLPRFIKSIQSHSLYKILQKNERNDEMIRCLSRIFEKSLEWLAQKFDHQSIKDAVGRIRISKDSISQKNCWIYVMEGCLQHQEITYSSNEFIILQSDKEANAPTFKPDSLYVYLSQKDLDQIKACYAQRFNKKIIKFIRNTIFYSHYLDEYFVNQFINGIHLQNLPYKSPLKWSQDSSTPQIAIIYKGVISIEYKSRRNIQIAEITKGMLMMNVNAKTQSGEISLNLKKDELQYISKFKYISKSDETILIVFDSKILQQKPYLNSFQVIYLIKDKYQTFCQTLKSRIIFDQESHLYRKKQSIKRQLKSYKKERIIYDSTMKLEATAVVQSPRMYSSINLHQKPNTINNTPEKNLSQSVISMSANCKEPITFNSMLNNTVALKNMRIHNSWVESRNKTPNKNHKSFSTLQNVNHYLSQRKKRNHRSNEDSKQIKQVKFFIPDQFVKKKLKLKYEGIVTKIKNFDLTIRNQPQASLTQRVKQLQQQINHKRIVKLDKVKKKYMLLRDKVKY